MAVGLRDVEPGGDAEDLAVDRSVTLTSLGFLKAALRRSAWLWCATAMLGIIIGYGLYAKFPPAYQATTSILVTNDPGQNPADAIATNVTLAKSQTVAGQALQQLGLNESVNVFLAGYTVTDPSDQVLVFTANAPSSAEAVRRASVLASVFLQFRANYLKNQLGYVQTALSQEVAQAGQQVNSINQQIAAESAKSVTPEQQTKLATCRPSSPAPRTCLPRLSRTRSALRRRTGRPPPPRSTAARPSACPPRSRTRLRRVRRFTSACPSSSVWFSAWPS